MSRPIRVPSYRLHKQSGQAVVTLTEGLGGRHDVLLGRYGTPESRAEYARVIAEWEAAGRRQARPVAPAGSALSVNELLLRYWDHAQEYYRKNGEPTTQVERIRSALRPLKELYGHTSAGQFGPLALKAVRERMIGLDWTRGYVNSCIGCIKRVFKWAVENELVPPAVHHGLTAVGGLKKGRTEARETQRVRPVEDEHVAAVLPYLTPPVQAMVQVQGLTGMRPQEVVLMRPCDLDRSNGKTWVYRPESHKTEHHDIARVVFIGPRAQEVLLPFLEGRHPGHYLFAPREAMAAFRAEQRQKRKSRVQPSQQNRGRKKPRKAPGERYSVDSYRQSVEAACIKAGVPHWHPNQLRHAAATRIRTAFGLEAAQVVLGHSEADVTQLYAERNQQHALQVMEEIG